MNKLYRIIEAIIMFATAVILVLAIVLMALFAVVLWNDREAGASTPQVTVRQWSVAFLEALGAPTSDSNVMLIGAWVQAEGTTARWNPLATTRSHPQEVGSHNSHGVRHYETMQAGIEAQVWTIEKYPTIYHALRRDDRDGVIHAPGFRTYCTCDPAKYVSILSRTDVDLDAPLKADPGEGAMPVATTAVVALPAVEAAASSIPPAGVARTASEETVTPVVAVVGLALVIAGSMALRAHRKAGVALVASGAAVWLGADAVGSWATADVGASFVEGVPVSTLALGAVGIVSALGLLIIGGMMRSRERTVAACQAWVGTASLGASRLAPWGICTIGPVVAAGLIWGGLESNPAVVAAGIFGALLAWRYVADKKVKVA